MRTLATVLTPAAATALALWLFAGGSESSAVPRPSRPAAELAGRAAAPETPSAPIAAAEPSGRLDPGPATAEGPEAAAAAAPLVPEEQAAALLAGIRERLAADPADPQTDAVAAVRDLLDRHPETAEPFLAAIEDADPGLWRLLGEAFREVADPALRMRLIAAHRAKDPVKRRLVELFADAGRTLSTIEDPAAELRMRVLDGVPDALLADPRVLGALRRIAEGDPDPAARGRAIARLARCDAPGGQETAIRILEDETRSLADREIAALVLSGTRTDAAHEAFSAVLGTEREPSLLIHSVNALGRRIASPGVADSLLAALERTTLPPAVREQAATAIVRGLPALRADERESVLARLRGFADGLAGIPAEEEILVHVLGELLTNLGDAVSRDVKDIVARTASPVGLKERIRADFALVRFAEDR